MKTITKTILALGLLASTSLMANDTISAFYPLEDNDTPDYILNNSQNDHSKVTNVLAKSTISKDALLAFYPPVDNDTPDYILNNNQDNQSSPVYTVAKSSISEKTICALYPEDTDSPRKSC